MNFSEGVKTPLPSKFITLQFASLSKAVAKIVQSRDYIFKAQIDGFYPVSSHSKINKNFQGKD
jgi:hypothetical protein